MPSLTESRSPISKTNTHSATTLRSQCFHQRLQPLTDHSSKRAQVPVDTACVSAHPSAQRRLIITISIQSFGVQELPRYIRRVTMLPVNLKIHLAHFLIRNFPRQLCNRHAHFRMP